MTSLSTVKVGMADLGVLVGAGSLKTTGLGSCVGLTLHDPVARVSGMAHIMLPTSSIAREGSNLNKAKYADTAIPELIDRMQKSGAMTSRMVGKMAGGAQMFAFAATSESMRIGPRNVESCKAILAEYGIPLKGEDTGGNYGRTIELLGDTGILIIRSVNQHIKEL
ncbi:putative chemoreceptor glutamine deamidase CheD [Xylanibacillus composti]|uniref:Probable chemoreceptor glutamine deamidase CheD n=1 Tax=Xylanibacillus composti TaxID=1572762 RepID=A0A8J4H2U3_9BACL|nr:chemotaxis protein CheD [Xylanibacillus composti]GIQ68620.1 putative chemoreceptor glutamine deamidase CheD [Xylanibacillus composti]